jgi:hypothetical protein
MHLNELFNRINDQTGSCHLRQWIKDCLGFNQFLIKDPLRIKDFSGDTTAKIICLNFLKEVKYNMPRNPKYHKAILYLEDYFTLKKHPHPIFRIQGVSSYLSQLEPELLCIGKKIGKKPLYFSNITTLQNIINYNIPDGSSIPLEDINDRNVNEKLDTINHRTTLRLPMNPLRTGLPLFWCTGSNDITRITKNQKEKQNNIRNELGLYNTRQGYLVEFRLSRDYVNAPKKPVIFDSGPNEYFSVTQPKLKYGRTRRLSDFTVTEFKELVHQEKDWPYHDKHFIIPLGKLEVPPEATETDRKEALEAIWKELIIGFPETIQEIREL